MYWYPSLPAGWAGRSPLMCHWVGGFWVWTRHSWGVAGGRSHAQHRALAYVGPCRKDIPQWVWHYHTLTMVTRERECRGCRTIYQYNTKVLCQMFSIVSWKKDTGCNYMVLCRAPTGPARTQRRCTAKSSSWARPNQGFSGEHYYLKQEMDKFRKWFKYFASGKEMSLDYLHSVIDI